MFDYFTDLPHAALDATTIGFCGTLTLGVYQAYGLKKQIATILEKRSGENNPPFLNAYITAEYFTFSLYGYLTHHLAMLIVGILGFGFLAIYVLSTKYPGNSGRKWWHVLVVLFIPAIYLWTNEWLLTAIIAGVVATFLQWPQALLKDGHTGALESKMLWSLSVSMLFWVGYFYGTHQWWLFVINLVALAILAGTLRIWYHYYHNPRPKL